MKLPKNITITDKDYNSELLDDTVNFLNELLSEKYGYCLKSYGYSINIKIADIEWDTEE